jgi:alkanesulfonate monooxygenase
MSVSFYWRLPGPDDVRNRAFDALAGGSPARLPAVHDIRNGRYGSFDHVAQVARAAELAAFDGIIAADDPGGDASLITLGALAREVRRVRLIATFSPGIGSAVYAAKKAVSFQRYTGNRFGWALQSAPDAARRRSLGDFVTDADLATRLEEFLVVARGVVESERFSYDGRFFGVLDGGFQGPLSGRPFPELTLSGDSDAAVAQSARLADVHAFNLGATDLAARIGALHAQARSHGRTVEVALRARIVSHPDGQRARLEAARAGIADAPDLITGSYDEVAARIEALQGLGVQRFELSAPRSLDEVYRTGEHVLPRVRRLIGKEAA